MNTRVIDGNLNINSRENFHQFLIILLFMAIFIFLQTNRKSLATSSDMIIHGRCTCMMPVTFPFYKITKNDVCLQSLDLLKDCNFRINENYNCFFRKKLCWKHCALVRFCVNHQSDPWRLYFHFKATSGFV